MAVSRKVSALCAGLVAMAAQAAWAQQSPPPPPPPGHEPPPQAYEDCKGRNAGDAVQHMTREGKVAATCADSPKGLVARPDHPPGPPPGAPPGPPPGQAIPQKGR